MQPHALEFLFYNMFYMIVPDSNIVKKQICDKLYCAQWRVPFVFALGYVYEFLVTFKPSSPMEVPNDEAASSNF